LLVNISGYKNTALGYSAGSTLTNGDNNTCVGYDAQPSGDGVDNSVTLGNASVATLRCATDTITTFSDVRDKADVSELGDVGLELIGRVIPRKWHWDRREWYADGNRDGTRKAEDWSYGFVAQELDEVQSDFGLDLGLVYKANPERLEATPRKLLPILVKAVQELKAKVEALKGA
jgi:hypothetical protein